VVKRNDASNSGPAMVSRSAPVGEVSPVLGALRRRAPRLYLLAVRHQSALKQPMFDARRCPRDSLPVPAALNGVECVDKVIAYITRGERFIVFEQPEVSSAGIQVPGGTVEEGESLEEAVLREANEETGLSRLRIVRALGVQLHRRPSGRIHRRHYFHLEDHSEAVPDVWEHYEEFPHCGSAPILYRLGWADLHDPPPLEAELDHALHQLRLGLTKPSLSPFGRHRHAARALILDDHDRVLLLQARISGQPMWVTPGGGVERDECYASALQREVAEEVGVPLRVGPIVWVRRFSGAEAGNVGPGGEFTEVFFSGRALDHDVSPLRPDDYVIGHKWWSVDELIASRELFAPRALPTLLPSLIETGAINHGTPTDIGL
jgi:8-oxo-dGTP diphosphatase